MFIENDNKIKNNTFFSDVSQPYILKLENISKKFNNNLILDNVSFEILKKESIGLIGGNGAGKSTISEIISGIIKPTSGNIIFGFDYKKSPNEFIGMQFQQSEYPSGLTVKDILMFAIKIRKLKIVNKISKNINNNNKKEITKKQIEEYLNVFQLSKIYNKKVKNLSYGQRQKLNILMSIIHNPKIIILDELSTGLDIFAREEIIKFTKFILKKYNISAILISHHMAEIREICSKIIVLNAGKVELISSIKDLEIKYGSLEKYLKKIIFNSFKEKKSSFLKTKNKKNNLNFLYKKFKQIKKFFVFKKNKKKSKNERKII